MRPLVAMLQCGEDAPRQSDANRGSDAIQTARLASLPYPVSFLAAHTLQLLIRTSPWLPFAQYNLPIHLNLIVAQSSTQTS